MTSLAISPGYSWEPYLSPGASETAQWSTRCQQKASLGMFENAFYADIKAQLDTVFLEASNQNWDGYGAEAADIRSFENAFELIKVLPRCYSKPEITVDPDGEVCLEWYRSPAQLVSISVSAKGMLNYIAFIGKNRMKGTEAFDGEFPRYIEKIFKRVFPEKKQV